MQNPEFYAASIIAAKAYLEGDIVARIKSEARIANKLRFVSAVNQLRLTHLEKEEFDTASSIYFSALESIVRHGGRRRGLRRWQLPVSEVATDADDGRGMIAGNIVGKDVFLTQEGVYDGKRMLFQLHSNQSGHICGGGAEITRSGAMPDFMFSNDTDDKRERDMLSGFMVRMGVSLLTTTATHINDGEREKKDNEPAPSEIAKNRVLQLYHTYKELEIGSVIELFVMANLIGEALEDVVITNAPADKILSLSHGESNERKHWIRLEVGGNRGVYVNRNHVVRGNLLHKGVNEGDEVNFRRFNEGGPIDILNGVVNDSGISTKFVIKNTDATNHQLDVAAKAIIRVTEDTLRFI
jgi:hypothetical protein